MSHDGAILFTAFEPSGDALAAALIDRLRRRGCTRPIHALGGPLMAAAGAALLQRTTDSAVMLAGAVAHAAAHRRRIRLVEQWIGSHDVAMHVPTDSPAANWAMCKLVRRHCPRARIVHLAAPQLWAWAPWRIRRLRRLTDRVLCLLPFEPDWFCSRGVQAEFVGHPLYDQPLSPAGDFAPGSPRLALLPGSRGGEVARNWPTMRAACALLREKHPDVRMMIAASDDRRADQLAKLNCEQIPIVVGRAGEVLAWADVVLVVSGTATLQCARYHRPMVAMYNVNRLAWHGIGRWLVRTRTFTLPNLLGESMGLGRVIPELVPHFADAGAVAAALEPLMSEGAARAAQRAAFAKFEQVFAPVHFADAASAAVERMLG